MKHAAKSLNTFMHVGRCSNLWEKQSIHTIIRLLISIVIQMYDGFLTQMYDRLEGALGL